MVYMNSLNVLTALTFVDSDDDSEAENKAPPVEKPIVVEEKALVEEKPGW